MRVTALAAALTLMTSSSDAQQASGALIGAVVDATNGHPIAKARVTVEPGGRSALANARGVYHIGSLPSGDVQVSCSAPGYQARRNLSVAIRAGANVNFTCRLHPSPAARKHKRKRTKKPTGCVDEVTCLLATSPPACCRKFSRSWKRASKSSSSSRSSRRARSGSKKRPPAKSRYRVAHKKPASRVAHRSTGAIRSAPREHNTENYEKRDEQPFLSPRATPLSTFSIDVDTASYSNVRRFIAREHKLPPADAVKIEEMVNYFTYDYTEPTDKRPFAVHTEIAKAPWNPANRLVQIGIQGQRIATDKLPSSNLVFLIDVSGSMRSAAKLPLLKRSFSLLVNELRPDDRVAIAVYAGAAGLVLPSTAGSDKQTILDAIERLYASGSTAGAQGIQLAYQVARQNFIKGGNNRVILATDGDFNVGVSSDGELVRLIEREREGGVFLTVLGFGSGNYKDAKMEKLADRGNGNHAYIDSLMEARKVLVSEMGGSLFTIAKDVKLQVEFNPKRVKAYRLIGYENRRLAARDFNDDRKDAGDLGAGHSVTAFYEIVPAASETGKPGPSESPGATRPAVDPLRYQDRKDSGAAASAELLTVKLRYKRPSGKKSRLIQQSVVDRMTPLAQASNDFRFAAAVAEFGLLLQGSKHKGQASYQRVISAAQGSLGKDRGSYRRAFVELVRAAASLGQPAQIARP